MKDQNSLFNDISQAFSEPRLSAYLKRPECQDTLDALAAYYWNIQLSESFYVTLQSLEVALRNALHRSLTQHFQTENWFDNSFLHSKEQTAINQAKITLTKQNKLTDANRIVAELHFGFWTSLFDVRYEHHQILWPHLLTGVFPFIPKSLRTRRYLSKQLNCVRNLRNRIFHYEPIWYWKDLPQQHQNVLNLLQWLSPTAYQHIMLLDHFQNVHQQGFLKNRSLLVHTFLIADPSLA